MSVPVVTWGEVAPGELERIVVVSPHFDDAALGAAHLLTSYRGSTVVTVFGGRPPAYPAEPTSWDACGGFVAGDDVVALRRLEDVAAMEVLGAVPRWLEFADHQYLKGDERARPDEVAPELGALIRELGPTAVFLPWESPTPTTASPMRPACWRARACSTPVSNRPGSVTRTPDTSTCLVFSPGGWPSCSRAGSGPRPPSSPCASTWRPSAPPSTRTRARWRRFERDHSLAERLAANVPEQYWRIAPPPAGWESLTDSL